MGLTARHRLWLVVWPWLLAAVAKNVLV
jgi:hypothetical protein